MRTIATPTYYYVAFAQNCVANCSATPDKLFPVQTHRTSLKRIRIRLKMAATRIFILFYTIKKTNLQRVIPLSDVVSRIFLLYRCIKVL